jgi:hypothetical protein
MRENKVGSLLFKKKNHLMYQFFMFIWLSDFVFCLFAISF